MRLYYTVVFSICFTISHAYIYASETKPMITDYDAFQQLQHPTDMFEFLKKREHPELMHVSDTAKKSAWFVIFAYLKDKAFGLSTQ